jgi:Carboxypeptidase regulatory-like domain
MTSSGTAASRISHIFSISFITVFLLGVVTLALPCTGFAQAVTGTILGTVKDPSGIPISQASVHIVNTATGEVRNIKTNDEGTYEAPNLPPGGPYRVEVESQGFKKSTMTNVSLNVDQKAHVDVAMSIGSLDQTVEVVAAVPLVQSDSSELGTTVNGTQIRELPLNGRNFVQLTRLIPGVQLGIPGSNSDGSGNLGFRASASFAANGMRPRDNSFILDGVDDNELLLSTVVIIPSVDALQEFKVQTSTYSAEFGRSLGGVVNLQLKSGTNAFHGNLFEFIRNDKLDANDWFNDANHRAKPPFRQNQFGGTLGGPIWKNHTFFFVDYQGLRVRQANSFLSTVPTAAMKEGDFSAINRNIYDPVTKLPFTGNIIPSARFDPAAKNVLDQLYANANVTGSVGSNGQIINNYLINPSSVRNDNQFDVKIDHQLTEKNVAFVRYSYEDTFNNLPATLPHGDATVTSGAAISTILAQSAAINDTYTITPRLLNEFRFGFSRFSLNGTPIDYGSNLATKVGIPGINFDDLTSAFTQIAFTPSDIRSIGTNSNQPFIGVYNMYQVLDNVTYSLGKHTLKVGASLTLRQRNQFNVSNPTGRFTFGPQITSNCAGKTSGCTLNSNTGFSVATFLLGYASTEARDYRSGLTGERKHELAFFIQDDYKVFPTLTLNLGLRYDFLSPYVEEHDRMANFDATSAKMVSASDGAAFANGQKVGRALRANDYTDFGPRIGFAWVALPNNRLVVRGGYGIFYDSPLTGGSSQMTRNFPFGVSQSFNTTYLPTLQLSAGIPAIPALNSNSPLTGSVGSAFDPNLRDERGQNWNLDLQTQLGKDYLLEAAYVGSNANHLLMDRNINQAPATVGVTNQNINRPYYSALPLVTNVTQVEDRAYSWYHSLQLKGTKRFAHNFMFLAAYTLSKSTDVVSDVESSPLDAYNIDRDRGPSNFDVRNNLTVSFNYSLPFGQKKIWGGWELSGITSLHTGVPFTVTQSQGVLSTGTGNRPNRIKSGALDGRSQSKWFDTTAFTQVIDTTGTYGNSGRNILSSPPTRTQDLSIFKNTNFLKINSQFRCEFFNISNTPQFAAPNSTLGAAGFGSISSLLFNTPMRQIQFGLKLNF